MLRRTIGLGVVCGLMLVYTACQSAKGPAGPAAVEVKSTQKLMVDPPITKDNLTVWLVRGPDRSNGRAYLTLSEAMEQKKLVVHETGDVNQLAVENVSDEVVFIPAGSIVKGGRQDRTLGTDVIISKADGKMPIDAFCVEHGRWSQRGQEQSMFFASNTHMVSGKEMKLASNTNTTQPSQGEVWQSVATAQKELQQAADMSLSLPSGQAENARPTGGAGGGLFGGSTDNIVTSRESASSYQLTRETEAVKKLTEGRKAALINAPKGQKDVVGYVYAVNNKIAGGNVYASPALFAKLWPMLLDSAVVESVTEAPTTQPSTDGQAAVATPPLPSQMDVAATLADRNQATNTRQVNGRTTVKAYDAPASVMTDTVDAATKDDAWICRSVLAK